MTRASVAKSLTNQGSVESNIVTFSPQHVVANDFSEWRVVMSILISNVFYSMLKNFCAIRSLAYSYSDKRKSSWYIDTVFLYIYIIYIYHFFLTGRHLTSGPYVLFSFFFIANQRDIFFVAPQILANFIFPLSVSTIWLPVLSRHTHTFIFVS